MGSETRQQRTKSVLGKDLEFQVIDFYTKDIREKGFVIYLFGVTPEGESVCCEVLNYKPYFYVRIPSNFSLQQIDGFQRLIKNSIHKYQQPHIPTGLKQSRFHTGKIAYGFRGNQTDRFLRFDFPFESTMYATRKAIRECNSLVEPVLFEAKAETLIKFIHDINFISWVRIPAKKVKYDVVSTCEYDFSVDYRDIQAFENDNFAPILQCSMDIEVTSENGDFPNPHNQNDCVFQIASTFKVFGKPDFFLKHILVYGACEDVSDADQNIVMVKCESEMDLLLKWAELIKKMDPDIIYTYNGWGFDYQYMFVRAQKWFCQDKFCADLSRLYTVPSELKEETFSSGAYGTSNYKILNMPGRVNFDVHVYLRRETKLEKYKLDYVAEHYLGEKKNPVTPKMIFEAFQTQDARKTSEVAYYCIQDTLLPQKLVDKLCMLSNQLEMAKATYVPFSYLLNRGQQIKVYSQILKYARRFNYLIPDESVNFELPFTGGKVLDPNVGAYWSPVATLDFASLYPSIIRAHNFCYTTIVLDPKYDNLPGYEYKEVVWQDTDPKSGHVMNLKYRYVQNSQSILPVLLSELYQKRKAVKKLMAAATDDFQRSLLNGKQLALKVSMNSVYGFLDANKLPCKPIALSTTAMGRQMIDQTKNFVEANYPPAKIVYGDSVMPYTPIVLKNKLTGEIELKEIKDLDGGATEWKKWHQTKENVPISKYQAWTSEGWSDIVNLVRHRTTKRIYRIVSQFGIVDVTEDHSLLNNKLELLLPTDVVANQTQLFSSLPYDDMFHLNQFSNIYTPYKNFLYFGPTFTNQLEAQQYFWQLANRDKAVPKLTYVVGKRVGYRISPEYNQDYNPLIKYSSMVYSCSLLMDQYHGYVYDLETRAGNFQAGVGCLIVKNTDSVFVDFRKPDLSFNELFELAQRCADHTTTIFKKPIELEFEKVYFPFFIFAKKKYIGKMFTHVNDKGKTSSTGITNRRDMCHFIREMYEHISQLLLDERLAGIPKVKTYLKMCLNKIMAKEFPMNKFTITKTIRDVQSYSGTTKTPQLEVAKKKQMRGETVDSNDKITYVIVKTKGKTGQDVSQKAEDYDYAVSHGMELDLTYYVDQLKRNLEPLLLLVMGKADLNYIFNGQPPITMFFKRPAVAVDEYKEDEKDIAGASNGKKRDIKLTKEDLLNCFNFKN